MSFLTTPEVELFHFHHPLTPKYPSYNSLKNKTRVIFSKHPFFRVQTEMWGFHTPSPVFWFPSFRGPNGMSMELSNYLVSWVVTYLGALQPT